MEKIFFTIFVSSFLLSLPACSNSESFNDNGIINTQQDLAAQPDDTYEETPDIEITVERLIVDYNTNSYFLICGDHAIIVDPGSQPEVIATFAGEKTIDYLLLTHGHFDHIMGLDVLKKRYPDSRIAIHEADEEFLFDPELNMSSSFIDEDYCFTGHADILFTENDYLPFCGKDLNIIHLPGHTPGSSAFFFDTTVICGDTLMKGGIGVIDLPHSDKDALIGNIRSKLLILDDATVVYPGHGPATTIGEEKDNNPYFQDQLSSRTWPRSLST